MQIQTIFKRHSIPLTIEEKRLKLLFIFSFQKQPFRGVLGKKCSENIQSNFIEIPLQHRCSPVNLMHIFRTPFQQNTFEWLLLSFHVPITLTKDRPSYAKLEVSIILEYTNPEITQFFLK